MSKPLPGIRSILVIKLRAIGDVLLSTVVLNNLRASYPDAVIDFLTEVPARDVVEGHTAVSSVLVFDHRRQSGLSLIAGVRKRRYDCVIDLFGNPRSALVTLFSGARLRVGYRFGWRRWCYNRVAEPRGSMVHNRDFNLDALALIGARTDDRSVTVPVAPEAEAFAADYFRSSGFTGLPVVGMHFGGGWYTKRWPLASFAAVGDAIVQEFGAKIILCWGPGEKGDAEEVQRLMKHPAGLIPPATLGQLAAILKRCAAMVTNDSGPMHIAAAVGTPVVAVFGPTNPALQGPLGNNHVVIRNETLGCLGCNLTKCPIGIPCMKDVRPDQVMEGFRRLWQNRRRF